jgi:PAS domain S-box-containing protein
MTTHPASPFNVLYVGTADALDERLEHADPPAPLDVECVETAAEALDLVETGAVDGVVSEHDLPDRTGLDLLRSVRSLVPGLPFVLFTDAGDEALASRAVAADVDGYVPQRRGLGAVVDQLVEAFDGTDSRADESERRYRELVRTSPAPINLFDASGEIVYGNDAVLDLLGLESRSDLVGRSIFEFVDPDDRETAEAELERVVTEGVSTGPTQMQVVRADGERRHIRVSTAPGEYGGEPVGQAVVTDVNDLLETQRALRTERRFVERAIDTLVDVFYVASADGELERWNDRLPELTGYTQAELAEMNLRDLVVGADVPTVEEALDRVREQDEAVTEVTLVTKDGETFPVEARSRRLDTDDGHGSVVGIARDVSDREARETQLVEQREQLALLDRTSAIVRDVNAALVTAESREEVESGVCERLVDAGPYRLAWVGAFDQGHQTVAPRVWAGDHEGYLDTLTLSVDADDPTGQGPVGRAIRTGEVQTNAVTDSEFEPWREAAETRGYERVTAVPITYDDVTYGVLVVYSGPADGLGDTEPSVLGELGRTVGAAINAAARKRALVADPAVELEFAVRDETEFFNRFAVAVDARVDLETVTPLDGGGYNVCLTVETADTEAVASVCDRFTSIDSWSLLTDRDRTAVFELRVTESLVVDLLGVHGSVLESLAATPEESVVSAGLPANTDVRPLVELLRRTYRTVDVRAQRERAGLRRPRLGLRFDELLTERQQEVLQSAYVAGYFEEPRETRGVEIAESLGISGPTFHHHLRSAQRRLFTELFATRTDTDPRKGA